LYDTQEDPGELRNRSGEPETEAITAALRQRLHDWMLAHV
jgi:hypothetical protein